MKKKTLQTLLIQCLDHTASVVSVDSLSEKQIFPIFQIFPVWNLFTGGQDVEKRHYKKHRDGSNIVTVLPSSVRPCGTSRACTDEVARGGQASHKHLIECVPTLWTRTSVRITPDEGTTLIYFVTHWIDTWWRNKDEDETTDMLYLAVDMLSACG